MIKNLVELKDYFKAFAAGASNAFVYGPAAKLVEKSRSDDEFNYPVLHLNRPQIKPADNGMANYTAGFWCEVTALAKYEADGSPEQNDESELAAEHATLQVLLALGKQMNHDNAEGLLVFDINHMQIDPVMDRWIDYHTGWKMIFRIDITANGKLC